MTERQIDERLRAWYQARSEEAPQSLYTTVAAIPDEVVAVDRPLAGARASLLLAAVLGATVLLAGALAVGSGILRPPWNPLPEVPTTNRAPVAFDACRALPADALTRLFPGRDFSARAGGSSSSPTTGEWPLDVLGSSVRTCLYESADTAIAVHVSLESTRRGEAYAIARAMLGENLEELGPDEPAWSVVQGGDSALVVQASANELAGGYLAAVTMLMPAGQEPPLAPVAAEIRHQLAGLATIPMPCDVLRAIYGVGDDDDRYFEHDASEDVWRACAYAWDGGWSNPHLLINSRFLSRERAEQALVDEDGITDLPATWTRDGDRWTALGDGWHAVAMSCEPFFYVVTHRTSDAAEQLAIEVSDVVCMGQ